MLTMQVVFYISAVCACLVASAVSSVAWTPHLLLDAAQATVFTPAGWVSICGLFAAAFATAAALPPVVERAKKAVDFTFTVFFVHGALCAASAGAVPLNATWWLSTTVAFVVAAALGEYLCVRREMSEISVDDILRRRKPAASLNAAGGGGASAAGAEGGSIRAISAAAPPPPLLSIITTDDDVRERGADGVGGVGVVLGSVGGGGGGGGGGTGIGGTSGGGSGGGGGGGGRGRWSHSISRWCALLFRRRLAVGGIHVFVAADSGPRRWQRRGARPLRQHRVVRDSAEDVRSGGLWVGRQRRV